MEKISVIFRCRELNAVDTVLWERARQLLAQRLAEQQEAGILEQMPSGDDATWALQRQPTAHKGDGGHCMHALTWCAG